MPKYVSALVPLLVLALGCPSDEDAPPDDAEQRIVDLSGAEFIWTGTHVHRIAGVSPEFPKCEADQEPGYRLVHHRFAAVSGDCSGVWWGFDRIVVCESDDDCPIVDDNPAFAWLPTYECRAGLCQSSDLERWPADELDYVDLFQLCFGETPRTEDLFTPDDWPNYPGGDAETIAWIDDGCPASSVLDPCPMPLPSQCVQPW